MPTSHTARRLFFILKSRKNSLEQRVEQGLNVQKKKIKKRKEGNFVQGDEKKT
jgi:hypothetical protein